MYFILADLARERVQTTSNFLAVYHRGLDTGYIYTTNGRAPRVTPRADGRYELDGQAYAADPLPLQRVIPVEAFFFAWQAFYPASESV